VQAENLGFEEDFELELDFDFVLVLEFEDFMIFKVKVGQWVEASDFAFENYC
jgi:hypothetical protein